MRNIMEGYRDKIGANDWIPKEAEEDCLATLDACLFVHALYLLSSKVRKSREDEQRNSQWR